jgi:hypothetical protein
MGTTFLLDPAPRGSTPFLPHTEMKEHSMRSINTLGLGLSVLLALGVGTLGLSLVTASRAGRD